MNPKRRYEKSKWKFLATSIQQRDHEVFRGFGRSRDSGGMHLMPDDPHSRMAETVDCEGHAKSFREASKFGPGARFHIIATAGLFFSTLIELIEKI
jgi:hypothetical protein